MQTELEELKNEIAALADELSMVGLKIGDEITEETNEQLESVIRRMRQLAQ